MAADGIPFGGRRGTFWEPGWVAFFWGTIDHAPNLPAGKAADLCQLRCQSIESNRHGPGGYIAKVRPVFLPSPYRLLSLGRLHDELIECRFFFLCNAFCKYGSGNCLISAVFLCRVNHLKPFIFRRLTCMKSLLPNSKWSWAKYRAKNTVCAHNNWFKSRKWAIYTFFNSKLLGRKK